VRGDHVEAPGVKEGGQAAAEEPARPGDEDAQG
jgi:hypothetical protein